MFNLGCLLLLSCTCSSPILGICCFFGRSHGCSHSFCGMSSYALSVLGCTNRADLRGILCDGLSHATLTGYRISWEMSL